MEWGHKFRHFNSAQIRYKNSDPANGLVQQQRPDLHPPIIDLEILRPEIVTPGYIFLAPYRNLDPGPYIYDNAGHLVWSGAAQSGPKTAHAPRPCEYKGTTHLCYFQGEQQKGFARGHGVIMNQNYRIVETVESSGAGASSDMHEFRITPYSNGTTALMTVYQIRQYDLTTNPRFGLMNGMGWLVEGVFQEVNIETEEVIFEWRSLDHLDPSLSITLPGTSDTSGDGVHQDSAWDYFHLNSIDKNADGDYLLSARHMNAIYKISGVDGQIIWEMGGSNPTFDQSSFVFSYQHHARWESENATHSMLSFYDNGSNGRDSTNEFSHGWLIMLDHINDTATIIKEWGTLPEEGGGLLSGSQGNMQLLPNGGCHIGWGEHAHFSEYTADGSLVQYGKLADRASNVMIYRSGKYNWTGTPLTKPAVWTYSRTGHSHFSMMFYISWNGATEVVKWNLYGAENATGPFQFLEQVTKTGFETDYRYRNFTPWAYAEAVDANDMPLERSVIAKTFVPSDTLRGFCDDRGCAYAGRDEAMMMEQQFRYFEPAPEDLSINRGFNTSGYYTELPDLRDDADDSGPADLGMLIIDGGLALGLVTFIVVIFQRAKLASHLETAGELIWTKSGDIASLVPLVLQTGIGAKIKGYRRSE